MRGIIIIQTKTNQKPEGGIIMKKKVMQRAWELARQGVKQFGGKAKEYFPESLRMAWAETKKVYIVETHEAEKVLEIVKYGENGIKLVEAEPCEKIVSGGGKYSMPRVTQIYKSANPLLIVKNIANKVSAECKDTYLENVCSASFVCGETYAIKETLKYTGFKWDKIFKAWVSTDKELSVKDSILLAPVKKPCKVSKDDEDFCALTGKHELGDFRTLPKVVLA
jgi:hypothetical protein